MCFNLLALIPRLNYSAKHDEPTNQPIISSPPTPATPPQAPTTPPQAPTTPPPEPTTPPPEPTTPPPTHPTILSLPDEILDRLPLLARMRQDLPALVLVNKRFHNIYTPHLYSKFFHWLPSPRNLYQMPLNDYELWQMTQILPRGIRKMQDFLRTTLRSQSLASHVKTLMLHGNWAEEVREWLGTRKFEEREGHEAWADVREELDRRGNGPYSIALLLRMFPNLEVLEIDFMKVDVGLVRRLADPERA